MRSAEFNREEVLRSVMDAFIAKGYNQTSMQDLKKATGLHPGSIYCAFTNKRGLLLAALEHYRRERRDEFAALFSESGSVIAGIEAYLAQVVDECERDEIKDCLLQKALSELAPQDQEVEVLISSILKEWHSAFQHQLELAKTKGEISQDKDTMLLAQYIVMSIYGLRTFSHTQPEAGTLRQLSEIVIMTIRGGTQ